MEIEETVNTIRELCHENLNEVEASSFQVEALALIAHQLTRIADVLEESSRPVLNGTTHEHVEVSY
jgi:hypothetical protein